jgi:CDP-diacylglycerol--serine O-phosphatidyltransferase
MKRRRDVHEVTEKRKRAVPFLPNFITTMSLFCGFYSLMFSLKGNYYMAAIFILISAFIDGIDGRVARMTNSTSEFGKEYDSLSDLVAFGVAPAIMVYLWQLNSYGRLGFIASFLFVACGALRLARFNIDTTGGMTHFTGLPIPIAAAAIASTYLITSVAGSFPSLSILIGVYILSFLMVSSIPYPSFKHISYIKAHPFQLLVAGVLLLVVVALAPDYMFFILAMTFIVGGAAWSGIVYVFSARREKKEVKSRTHEHETVTREDHNF